jgi:predicted DNA-binding protein
MASTRSSRVYTISLPAELAQKAEALAKRDSRSMSELFREAFRTYYAQQARRTDAEDVVLQALQSSPPAAATTPLPDPPAKDIVELFAPLRGLNMDFGRNPSTGRPVDL